MKLITFKEAHTRFLYILLMWFLNLSILLGKGDFRTNGYYDLDKDGKLERFVLGTSTSSILWIESINSTDEDTLWLFDQSEGLKFIDVEVSDINGDGLEDLIAVPDLNTSIGLNSWLYVFTGLEKGFTEIPYTLKETLFDQTNLRPTSLSLIQNEPSSIAVSFGAPVRESVIFNLSINDKKLIIKKTKYLLAPIIENGYAPVYVGSFSSSMGNHLSLISAEGNKLKLVLFSPENDFKISHSGSYFIDGVKSIISLGIKKYTLSEKLNEEGLIIPFQAGPQFLLTIENNELLVSPFKEQSIKPVMSQNKQVLSEIEKIRESLENEKISFSNKNIKELVKESINLEKNDSRIKKNIIEQNSNSYQKQTLKIPSNQEESTVQVLSEPKTDYSSLSPTLGDFLENVKAKHKENLTISSDVKEAMIPNLNEDMESVNWADNAGFTKLNLGEYSEVTSDSGKKDISLPEIDKGISSFTKEAIDALNPKILNQDTVVLNTSGDDIDLYYVLAMTPSTGSRDRYVFDGESPFGVSVNQVPSMGEPTHFQHGISANLANLDHGETFDFAYSLRDARLDSITTLTMVHDMQTNVVFMSISPTDDSVSQSYQPESFDPKLFEFPDYFFEGFPNSLDMDFNEKLIRFSFDGVKDSLYQGIYLSSTTPSVPTQSLAVFMDQGKLQAIRGEVVVRSNGYKKVTTEYDLTGNVRPEVLFSRLIQEFFPEKLKIKLLQGASLEEPIFGPKGKIPKVFREPRLPDAQKEQSEPKIPIRVKQSNIPEEKFTEPNKIKLDSTTSVPKTQEDENSIKVLQDELKANQVKSDTLKLEDRKSPTPVIKIGEPSNPDSGQTKENTDKSSNQNE